MGHKADFIAIRDVAASAFRVPTDSHESDGTLEWDSTTLVTVETAAAGERGLGYTYAGAAAATLINHELAGLIKGRDAMDVNASWTAMARSVRNLGRRGIAAMALSAVDASLWDLKARILRLPLAKLLGMERVGAPVYGSGGFTSYSNQQLQSQFSGWAQDGILMFKMKVGREPERDPERVRTAREAIGPGAALFVDANGAYSRKQALRLADAFVRHGVSWFEEPVSSDDLEGLRLIRDRAPAGMDIAAGEYGYDLTYFRRMLDSGAVDVLQADATRCGGVTVFLAAAALCEAHSMPFSAHTAPALHLSLACAARPLRHIEYFHDHARIENLLFEGAVKPRGGVLYPDLSRSGIGLELRRKDAKRYAIS